MCGFVGGVMRREVSDGDVRAFTRAVRTLAHRGPDDERVVVVPETRAVLAFRRLSIIDLAGGAQPMTTGTGQHLVFNGEIYNHREMRAALVARGAAFRTRSDSEVLLHAVRLDGVDGLEATKGMFAFAMLDAVRGELLLARDRLGIKQLYHTETRDGFFFASEPKALLALPGVRAEIDQSQLPHYFILRCAPSPATLFRGIARLAAGTSLRIDLATGQRTVRRFWKYPAPPAHRASRVPVPESVDRFEVALLEAVRRRLVADVPVGAFLSGGLDSSLVVAAMRRLGHADVQTFTATFPGSADDEAVFARRVSARFGTRHHERAVTAADCLAALPRWTELNDDLVADASSIPLLLISDRARAAGCKVMLAGEGADELFGGYGAHHKFLLLHRLSALVPAAARARLIDAAVQARLVRPQDLPRVREYFARRAPYLGAAALYGPEDLRPLLTDDAPPTDGRRALGAGLDALCRFDFGTRIPDDLLVRTDRATMGASIEARVPFLDHDLIALVNRLRGPARMVPGISKTTPRLLAQRWGVPYQTIVHRKIGFQIPLAEWFRGPMRGFWEGVLRERAVPGIRYDEVARLHGAHLAGRGSFEEILWRIAALETWHRRWIAGDQAAAELPQDQEQEQESDPIHHLHRANALAPQ